MDKYLEDKEKKFLTFIKLCKLINKYFGGNKTVIFHIKSVIIMLKKNLPPEVLFCFLQNAASEVTMEMREATQPLVENLRVFEVLSGTDDQMKTTLKADAEKEVLKSRVFNLWRRYWGLDVSKNYDFRKVKITN
ncbi:MAG: hypothetical protein ABIG60_01685 [Patescibacteria group bacterium]